MRVIKCCNSMFSSENSGNWTYSLYIRKNKVFVIDYSLWVVLFLRAFQHFYAALNIIKFTYVIQVLENFFPIILLIGLTIHLKSYTIYFIWIEMFGNALLVVLSIFLFLSFSLKSILTHYIMQTQFIGDIHWKKLGLIRRIWLFFYWT